MEETIAAVIISGIIQVVGLVLNNNVTKYRIEQLEKKVDKHNNLVERMTIVEQSVKSAHHRIDDLKEE